MSEYFWGCYGDGVQVHGAAADPHVRSKEPVGATDGGPVRVAYHRRYVLRVAARPHLRHHRPHRAQEPPALAAAAVPHTRAISMKMYSSHQDFSMRDNDDDNLEISLEAERSYLKPTSDTAILLI